MLESLPGDAREATDQIAGVQGLFMANVDFAKVFLFVNYSLCGRDAFSRGLFAIALVEPIDATCSVDQLLFSCEKRMTS